MWASDHGASNGAAVSQQDLLQYLGSRHDPPGLVASIAGEVYNLAVIGGPAEARLEAPLGTRFPSGTRVRWRTSAGCEILLPNEQGGASRWQPLSSATNAIPSATDTGRSP